MMDRIGIINRLRDLGLQNGMAVEVHGSLRGFGHVEGGADAIIEALMAVVGSDGSIVMPSYLISPTPPLTDEDRRMGLTLKRRILDEDDDTTDNDMGVIANTFRDRADTVTGKGIYRVTAWGNDAELHAASGFGRIIDCGGYALLLGVDIYRLSAMHYVEDVMPPEIRQKFAPPDEARAKYPESRWMIEAWSPEAKPWYKIQDEAYRAGMIKDGMIGQAKCMFFKVKPVIELYRKALLERPFELYGLDGGK
ncbi:MAG: AAC(3) family N-acetyltransferase [Oscillospiraceae bacterium]|nr:AAC(3) family N-acetyltransferase [Oscillospiraceae bacterium]